MQTRALRQLAHMAVGLVNELVTCIRCNQC